MSLTSKLGCCLLAISFGIAGYFAGDYNLLKQHRYSIRKQGNQEFLYDNQRNVLFQIYNKENFVSVGTINNLVNSLEQRIINSKEGFSKEEADKTLGIATRMEISTLGQTKNGSADPKKLTINYVNGPEGSELIIGYKSNDSTNYFIPIRYVGNGRIIGGTRKDIAIEGLRYLPELVGEIFRKSTDNLMKELGIEQF